MALFIARLGPVATASHQIAASVAAVLYMVPLSISIACSARTSFWLGAGQAREATQAVVLGVKLTMSSSVCFALLMVLTSQYIANGFSTNPKIVALAASLLLWVAGYHIADALQTLCAFLLRCYGVTVAPLVVYAAGLWGIGLFGGYQLAYVGAGQFSAAQSPVSFWLASTLAIALVASGLPCMLRTAVKRSLI